MQVGLLRAGRLLQHGLLRHLPELQSHGHRRDLHAGAGGDGAHARHAVHGHGRDFVRHRRQVQRRRGLPQLRREHELRCRELHRARRCRRRARATGWGCAGPRRPARARRISAAPALARCPARPRQRTARHGQHVREHELRQDPDRRLVPVGRERRLRVELLRQQRLLQQRLHRDLHVMLDRGQRRDLLADRGRARRRWSRRSARQQRRRRAATTAPATARARAGSTSAARSARRRCAPRRRPRCRRASATARGSAAPPATTACGKYTCDMASGACRTGCTGATQAVDCVAPNICNANICTLKPTGTGCTTAAECDSGFCAQGYCCNQACTGTCKSCALTGSIGACSNVAERNRAHAGHAVCGDRVDELRAGRHVQRLRALAATG